LKEWIYVNNSREDIQQVVEEVWKCMKDVETKHLKRLLKNAQYLFPKKIDEVDPMLIKEKLLDSFNERTATGLTKIELGTAKYSNMNASQSLN
jgi:hypothetical protein